MYVYTSVLHDHIVQYLKLFVLLEVYPISIGGDNFNYCFSNVGEPYFLQIVMRLIILEFLIKRNQNVKKSCITYIFSKSQNFKIKNTKHKNKNGPVFITKG